MTTIHSLKCAVPLSFVVSLAVTRCHSLSLVVLLVVIRCHPLYHSLSIVIRCHSLSLDVPLVCLFTNDPSGLPFHGIFSVAGQLEFRKFVWNFFLENQRCSNWNARPFVFFYYVEGGNCMECPRKTIGALYQALADLKFSPTSERAEPNEEDQIESLFAYSKLNSIDLQNEQ